MDAGAGSELGKLGWFLGVWVVMMAAMMFPSVAPTVALYARMARRTSPVAPLLFATGYLVTWIFPGLVAYGISAVGRSLLPIELSWHHAGRWIAGGTLIVAAAFELTPLKNVCLWSAGASSAS
jgi:predicted metal-binding membrane protein